MEFSGIDAALPFEHFREIAYQAGLRGRGGRGQSMTRKQKAIIKGKKREARRIRKLKGR